MGSGECLPFIHLDTWLVLPQPDSPGSVWDGPGSQVFPEPIGLQGWELGMYGVNRCSRVSPRDGAESETSAAEQGPLGSDQTCCCL